MGWRWQSWLYAAALPGTIRDRRGWSGDKPWKTFLLLLGDHEVIYNADVALKRALKLIPHIETTVIPGAGYAMNFDQPEMVNKHILAFLGQETDSSAGDAYSRRDALAGSF